MDDLAMLRAGVRFAQSVGRAPRRQDLREPARSQWQEQLGLELPSADAAARRFGGFTSYLARMGYTPNQDVTSTYKPVELAAMAHVEQTYPGFQVIESEQNAWDGEFEGQRIEVKGASLLARGDNPDMLYFSFKTHARDFTKTLDKVIMVGLGFDHDLGMFVPLMRLEFPKTALRLIDNKSTVMVYGSLLTTSQISKYTPYVRWRAKVNPNQLKAYLKAPGGSDEA